MMAWNARKFRPVTSEAATLLKRLCHYMYCADCLYQHPDRRYMDDGAIKRL